MIGHDILNNIIDKCPTPFYIFDEKAFIHNYKQLEKNFKAVYPNYQVSYSYKTNYTPEICKLVKALGGFAEVVSDMEYKLAKKLGYKGAKIVYNGPEKGDALYEHLEENGILNVDNLEELKKVVAYCESHPKGKYSIGLRINMDICPAFISRFGFEEGSDEYKEALGTIKSCKNLQLVGIHCHISRARGLEAWRQRTLKMIRVADEIFNEVPQYISLGSGMFGTMSEELSRQFGNNIPSYKDYAETVFRPFAERYKGDKQPMIFTEPGTTVVSRFISFITQIKNIRTIKNRNLATVDGSFHNLGEICELKKLPFTIIRKGNGRICTGQIDISGYTCLEQDILHPGFNGSLNIGDILSFENAGGYSIVTKPQFIKPNCPMYSLDGEGKSKLIMRAETFDDVFNKFIF